ncbi:MAG TPA: calcium/proton exchanger [Ktedonobacteraceae bacterium]|nr:calcium/proton exchanger [Ktedonobacteraceae bacterium]
MPRWLYLLLILAVVAPIIELVGGAQQETAIFIFSSLSLIPLAALIGWATENLEYYVGPIAGGLLNATFGNAPEIIIGIFALQQGLLQVVKASITGSIISNALLVLGGSLAIGGWRWGRQYFSNRDAGQYSAMMVLSVAGLLIPYTATTAISDHGHLESISIGVAIILLVVYIMYLAHHVFHVRAVRRSPRGRRGTKLISRSPAPQEEAEENGDKESESKAITGGVPPQEVDARKPPRLWLLVVMLFVATIGTAINSELLVGTIEPVAQQLGWSTIFIGLVIIPIVGNAAEHSSALFVAYRDRIDLSMAIAAGSSIQVATLVAPVLVLASLFFATPLDLVFRPLELVILGLATILFTFISLDGETSWLAGVQLVSVYIMACIVFFLLPG